MINNDLRNILIGNVGKVEKQNPTAPVAPTKSSDKDEFLKILNGETESKAVETDIRFSQHAMKRLDERSITLDSNEFIKLQNAFSKLSHKGSKESLVITDQAAYIVDVKNKMVVTAMDKQQLEENVFTKIDSAVFV